jgi:hypothetical protein
MDVLHMTYNDVMFKHSWLNIQLLMMDKLHYVGQKKEGDDDFGDVTMSKEQELSFLSKLKR